jgi:hypothetical protein
MRIVTLIDAENRRAVQRPPDAFGRETDRCGRRSLDRVDFEPCLNGFAGIAVR